MKDKEHSNTKNSLLDSIINKSKSIFPESTHDDFRQLFEERISSVLETNYKDEFDNFKSELDKFSIDKSRLDNFFNLESKVTQIKNNPQVKQVINKIKVPSRFTDQKSKVDEPAYFLIMDTGGICTFSITFNDHPEINKHLVAGFVTAINSFGKEALGASKDLDSLKYEDFKVILNREGDTTFCYIFNGNSTVAEKKLSAFKELYLENLETIFKPVHEEKRTDHSNNQEILETINDHFLM